MGSNTFGTIFTFSTFGESHGKALGVLIDGCPAGISITEQEIHFALAKRAPGRSKFTSPRKEEDQGEMISGVFEGKTTGAPIVFLVRNHDVRSEDYAQLKEIHRPGHASFTYLHKYGIYDYKGGGRASARETLGRVVAGVFAKKILKHYGISCYAYLKQVGEHLCELDEDYFPELGPKELFCPNPSVREDIESTLEKLKEEGDSIGGIVAFKTSKVPIGLGEPIYRKLEAMLAQAMMSLPASKSFEMGEGVLAATMKGSEHNDTLVLKNEKPHFLSNHAGGTLAGISTGESVWGQVAFKPTSSIYKQQKTLSIDNEEIHFKLSSKARHDPCVAIRAVPIVEAMLACVLADLCLQNRSSCL